MGALAGYYGGKLDDCIMRVMDVIYAIPGVLLSMVIIASFGATVPNLIIALGVGIGIILSAKLTTYLLNKHRTGTMSFILGLILMSAITIIPLKGYDVITVITSILTFILGAILVTLLEKRNLKEKTND